MPVQSEAQQRRTLSLIFEKSHVGKQSPTRLVLVTMLSIRMHRLLVSSHHYRAAPVEGCLWGISIIFGHHPAYDFSKPDNSSSCRCSIYQLFLEGPCVADEIKLVVVFSRQKLYRNIFKVLHKPHNVSCTSAPSPPPCCNQCRNIGVDITVSSYILASTVVCHYADYPFFRFHHMPRRIHLSK